MRRLKFTTVVTHETEALRMLNASIVQSGFDPLQILYTDPKSGLGHGHGFGQKMIQTYRFVCKQAADTLVVYVDGFDVLVKTSVSELLTKFDQIRCNEDVMVLGVERPCWPDRTLEPFFPKSPTPYLYPCAGCFMGSAGIIRTVLEPIINLVTDSIDDQRTWHQLFLLAPKYFKRDVYCAIFQNLSMAIDDVEFHSDGRWRNKITDSRPAIWHGNGPQISKNFLFNVMRPTLLAYSGEAEHLFRSVSDTGSGEARHPGA